MSSLKFTMKYVVIYVLIVTFQFQIFKDSLNYASPFVFMGIRFLIASLLLFGVARRFKPILNKDAILLSFFLWASTCCLMFGLEYVSPADSAVLSYSSPLFSIPISWVILSEKPTSSEWGGAIVGFLGVLVYSFALASGTLTVFGGLLTLLNAVFWAMFTVYCRKVRNQDPTMTVATQMFLTALLFLLCAPLNYKLVTAPNFWFDLAYLSILSGAGSFYLWNGIVRLRRIGKASTLVYLIPVTATLVQIVQTLVIPDALTLTGLGLMIFGLYLSNGTIPLHPNAKRLGAKISRPPSRLTSIENVTV